MGDDGDPVPLEAQVADALRADLDCLRRDELELLAVSDLPIEHGRAVYQYHQIRITARDNDKPLIGRVGQRHLGQDQL